VPVLGPAGNNQQPGPLKIVVGGGTLLPLPPTLYDLWVEYQTGIGGRKAARNFTAKNALLTNTGTTGGSMFGT
jgi:hypothetical protein